MRYNPWAKGIYERICGKQKTRKKKAATSLARKIAVLAWAMLRNEKDWDPKTMIQVTESFGKMNPSLKESMKEMKPKENHDQWKSRLRKEAREAKEVASMRPPKLDKQSAKSNAKQISKSSAKSRAKPTLMRVAKPKANRPTSKKTPSKATQPTSKPRRTKKPVSAG